MVNAELTKEQEEELVLLRKDIIQLKKELKPKLNSIYKQCLENKEPNLTFKSSFDGLTEEHIEFLALIFVSRFFKNIEFVPSSVKESVEGILKAPNEKLKEYATGFNILLGFNLIEYCLEEGAVNNG